MKNIVLLLALLLGPAVALAEGSVTALVGTQVAKVSTDEDNLLNNMAFYALSLAGTPYKYGGSSPDTGFDCSGFVGHVFRQSLGIALPRSTHEIWRIGLQIGAEQLHPGDLVFYNTLRHTFSHVGIYLGDGQFVHSPSSGGGIRVENMQEDYWRKRFNGARRIISGRYVSGR